VAVAVAAIGALDLALVALLLFLDKVKVQSQQELARVGLGMPLNWVTQNQGIDPPLPWRTSFMSPWENPTTIAWLPLVVNVVIVGLLMTGVWVGVQAVRGRRSAK
jgi:hypothetical protein